MICLFISIKKERERETIFELVIVIDEAIHRQVLDRLYARFDLLIDKKKKKKKEIHRFIEKRVLHIGYRSNL
jgi:hypothetical protein